MDENEVLRWLEGKGTRRTVLGMARYGIEAKHAFGVPMGTLPVAKRLAASEHAACRWVGKDALRELLSPKVQSQLARRAP
jgi:hypothetical protein